MKDRIGLQIAGKLAEIAFRASSVAEQAIYDGINERVLHICHANWWGIRSASEALPGWRMLIEPDKGEHVISYLASVRKLAPRYIFFQGYSEAAGELADAIKASDLDADLFAVTHVSPSQFDHQFEIDMINLMVGQKKCGILTRLYSVKPKFFETCDEFEELLLINSAPEMAVDVRKHDREYDTALIPLTRGLRKNMHVNHIALCRSSYRAVFSTAQNPELGSLLDDSKVIYLGHVTQSIIRKFMGSVGLISNVTLIECQPMVFNEGVSVLSPCLTGPVRLPFCSQHPLRRLTEINQPDDIGEILTRAEEIKHFWRSDKNGIEDMCQDYHSEIVKLSADSYLSAIHG